MDFLDKQARKALTVDWGPGSMKHCLLKVVGCDVIHPMDCSLSANGIVTNIKLPLSHSPPQSSSPGPLLSQLLYMLQYAENKNHHWFSHIPYTGQNFAISFVSW